MLRYRFQENSFGGRFNDGARTLLDVELTPKLGRDNDLALRREPDRIGSARRTHEGCLPHFGM